MDTIPVTTPIVPIEPIVPESPKTQESPAPTVLVPDKIPSPNALPSKPVQTRPPTPVTPPPTAPSAVQPAASIPNIVLKGSEAGNSYDVSVMGSKDSVRRGGYEPINLFMPLPIFVPNEFYLKIPDYPKIPGTAAARKTEFETVYARQGNIWRMKIDSQPEFALRPRIWVILEDAGFDIENADYKNGKNLRPVTLRFKVAPYTPNAGAPLQEVRISSSSGYSDIDDAVLFGFQRAKFSNTGSIAIEGSFTYRF